MMNKHHEEAMSLSNLANIQTLSFEERQILATQGQTAATLAVAYEQARAADEARTANLIAALSAIYSNGQSVFGPDENIIAAQITERLDVA